MVSSSQTRFGFLQQLPALLLIVASAWTNRPLAGEESDLPEPAATTVDFAAEIQPILRARCYDCHGPEGQESNLRLDRRDNLLEGGDSGEPALVVGNSRKSLLIRRVAGLDEDIMPPDGPRLTRQQIALFRAWIDQGAKMPAAEDGSKDSLTTDHWSFQPLVRPALPCVDDAWIRTPIDCFVLERLHGAGLAPAAEADRVMLIRRLYLNMLGLPPSPEEIDRFVHDADAAAYERLVDRVLASPRYGERWARHWLDVVRFAETHGFETNRERPTAYPFRDYVIRALNADLPYDRFVREQLAGDAMGDDVATGFLVAGPYDLVKGQDANLRLMQRQDELADMVNTTGTTFLALTTGCARCHSHKFDPIPQRDYYALQAVFAGVQHGDRPLQSAEDAERRERAEKLADRVAAVRQELAAAQPPPFRGRTIVIDDETDVVQQPGVRGVRWLKPIAGHGVNPAGVARGQRDDPGDVGRLPNLSRGRYTWWQNHGGKDVAAYCGGQAGRFRVWLSWGCGYSSHTRSAQYVLDRDGDPTTRDDQTTLATVDQQRFADGTGDVPSQALWSGFFDAGVHEFENSTCLLLRGGEDGSAITADTMILQEATSDAPAEVQPRLRPAVSPRENVERFGPVEARFLRFTVLATNQGEPCIDELEIFAISDGASAPHNVALASAGAKASASGVYRDGEYPIHQLAHVNDGQYGNSHSWISKGLEGAWIQIELPAPMKIDRIHWGRDREGQYSDRTATQYRVEVAVRPDDWQLVASSADRVPFDASAEQAVGFQLAALDPAAAGPWKDLLAELRAMEAELSALSRPAAMVYAGQFTQPGPTYRLYRGEPQAPREEVAPGALTVLGDLQLDKSAPEQQRRLALADWMVTDASALTARVLVNRLWHYHFGTGIVATPSDFGANGEPPSHPELLDWMADELIRSGWSIKHLQRQILLSSTYRQTSHPHQAGLAVDAGCRLLWRFPPRRLAAETIRDSVLAVSGCLDLRMGGPGFSAFDVQMENVRHYFAKEEFGPEDWRRMIYMTKVRQEQDGIFGAFDCPDGNQVMPRRSRSTTPLQALNLLNSRFMTQQAELLAERLRHASEDPAEQIDRAFRLLYGREADPSEAAAARQLATDHGLPAVCRAMLNANEFLFLP